MSKAIPLFALLFAGCVPTGDNGEETSVSNARSYATQISAPSPDYATLLKNPPLPNEGMQRLDATLPLPPDAKRIGEAWLARLKTRDASLGHGRAGKGSDEPVVMIDTGLTKQEFDSWAKENGWNVPRHIQWSFVPAMNLPRVSDAAGRSIRFWPASKARTGLQLQALFHGRVELRDGCFYVGQTGQPVNKLAWFHSEIGLDIDDGGYFILRDRVGGQMLARLGEDMTWGGPPSAVIDPQAERALRDACGSAEIQIVGSPSSRERFFTLYPHTRNPRNPTPPPLPPPPPAKRS